MEERTIFRNLSPLDHRYYLANRDLFESLANHLSEEAVIHSCIKVEASLLKTHIDIQSGEDPELFRNIDKICENISPDEVYQEEEKTQHNIRAIVNVMKRKLPEEIRPYVHLGATSVDILDTANAIRIRGALKEVIIPLLKEIEGELIRIAEQEAETPQVGRTHGQHAVPITFGFAIAEYVSRLGKSILEINRLSNTLRGKLAGAVGSYNATSLIVKDPFGLEEQFLDRLDLKPSEHSTQMVEPEYLLRILLEINIAFGIVANLADDLRHLQRSEINEIRELFTSKQVGSSTMPQKRNPWNSEHVKSLWKAFSPRVQTFFMDQISEHQRDLSNSASSRFVSDYLAGFAAALSRMKKVLSTLFVDRKRLLQNLSIAGDSVLAEAAYILLAVSGDPDAHEYIRKITLSCDEKGMTLLEGMKADPPVWTAVKKQLIEATGLDPETFFSTPALYRGQAVRKVKEICARYAQEMKTLS
jgi:adenylosuccinate lyase